VILDRGFIRIPDTIENDKTLSDTARRMYGHILRIASTHQTGCFAQNQYFEELFDIKKRQVERYLKELMDKGYLGIYRKRDDKHRVISRKLTPKVLIVTK
jgi:transcription initiation factor IIE alpha subunit